MLQVGVLGPLLVERDGANVVPSSPKPRALLIDLLLHCGESIARDRIIDDLWGEQPPTTAAGVVQNYVSQLRRYLGADVVATTGQGYALVAALVTTDVSEFEAHLDRARRARDAGALEEVQRATTDALALWRGEPLADVAFESFAQAEIARLARIACPRVRAATRGGDRRADGIVMRSPVSRPRSSPIRFGSVCGGC